jgi:tetratricopeptide (TPR) repeat protein
MLKPIKFLACSLLLTLSLSACTSISKDKERSAADASEGRSSLFGDKIKMPFQKQQANKNDATVQANLADQFYQSGDYVKAEEAYQQLLKIDPKQPAAYYRLGNIAFRNKEFKRASYYFNKSLELMPRNEKAQYNLAVTFLSLAEQHFKYYTAMLPQDADVSRITHILSAIDDFSADDKTTVNNPSAIDDQSLDDLAKQLQ